MGSRCRAATRATAAGLLAVLGATGIRAQRATPAAHARHVSDCIEALGSRDTRAWSPAMDELAAAGAAAVPALERCVRDDTGDGHGADEATLRAVRVLQRIGAPAASTVPALLDLLMRVDGDAGATKTVVLALGDLVPHAPRDRPAVGDAMLAVLSRAGPDGMRRMLQLDDLVDPWRTLTRTRIGPETRESELAGLLAADDPFAREYAAELLAMRDAAEDATVAALLAAVRGPHPQQFQPAGLPAMQPMEVFLDRRIQVAAARAMVAVAPRDERSSAAFALLLDRPQPDDRLCAVLAARNVGPRVNLVLPHLLRIAESEEPHLRREAITTLGILGPAAAAAAPLLRRLADDRDLQVRERARAALRQVLPPGAGQGH